MNQEENNAGTGSVPAPIDLTIAATKVLAIGTLTAKGMPIPDRFPVLLKEVPATLNLYLKGIIENMFVKPDASGPVFILNVTTVAEAHEILEALPFGQVGMMEFQLIPIGPLSPLRLLLNQQDK
ncbi:hypothetical protein [Mucilaginibacter aquaedulcis]|uniref:hypothetical protein n=1 Tax=Mucilaginibacter aquaedulcis TaxID=1187081 RepID=UPI0025B4C703|nr:hypothetical protein [Mucilaginibacter aquaedulcis]MDN3548855.1 hypothetical protein [Mucilaginibacter aquaedulcis]